MKLSIIVVSWNVNDLLWKCLHSIYGYASQIPFEVIVVDNASDDGSVDMIRREFKSVDCIVNEKNHGFAAACNQGIRQSKGEFVLFLNPDARLLEGSLKDLISYLDHHPDVGVVAPQLLNEDGSIQPSVRNFPTPWTALKTFLQIPQKLDASYSTTTEVDQPMGACLLIRRSALERAGYFDESFFLWMEEVDLCKRIKNARYSIMYVPNARVIHARGKSFQQKQTLEKQKFFYSSYAFFLKKHFGWKAALPYFLMKSYVGIIAHPATSITLGGIACVEIASLLGYFFPVVKTGGFFLIFFLTLVLSCKNLAWGVAVAFIELVIGSKGHLFSLPIFGNDLSIRIGIFCALMIAWLVGALSKKDANSYLSFLKSRFVRQYGLLWVFIAWGVIQGIFQQNNLVNLWKDSNAWMYFLFAFPLYATLRSRKELSVLVTVVRAALFALIVKTLVALYIMTHQTFGQDIIYSFYRWIRTTGVGEITQFEWGGVRIFFQSHIFALIAFFSILPGIRTCAKHFSSVHSKNSFSSLTAHKQWSLLFVGCFMILAISFSRSFWLAAGITFFCWIVFLFVRRISWKTIRRVILMIVFAKLLALLILFFIVIFPFPPTTGEFGIGSFAKRLEDLNSEAAAASRWSLLPVLTETIMKSPILGYGFGKTVTYSSFDPRVQQQGGKITTHAFEWGYLDFIVKMGIGGFVVYFFLLWNIFRRGYRLLHLIHEEDANLLSGLLLGLSALLIAHVFTPYLNHPLGIAHILFVSCAVDIFCAKKGESVDKRNKVLYHTK